jgi:hypothetical protein
MKPIVATPELCKRFQNEGVSTLQKELVRHVLTQNLKGD